MASPSSACRLIGNSVAAIALALILAWLYDHFAAWAGLPDGLFCWSLVPVFHLAQAVGLVLFTVGLVMGLVSIFKNQSAVGLMIGGILISFIPTALQRYLAVSCILSA